MRELLTILPLASSTLAEGVWPRKTYFFGRGPEISSRDEPIDVKPFKMADVGKV